MSGHIVNTTPLSSAAAVRFRGHWTPASSLAVRRLCSVTGPWGGGGVRNDGEFSSVIAAAARSLRRGCWQRRQGSTPAEF